MPDLAGSSMQIRSFVRMAPPDRLIEDGEVLELPGWDLRAVWTPGHSPGHLCFHSPSRRLVLSGDHVLPRISPNIAVHTQQIANPLADYLASLGTVEHLECDEVLPGHEWRFSGLAERVEELRRHHRARLDEILAALAADDGLTCWELTMRLTWSRPLELSSSFIQRAASGETLAHLVLLESRGRGRPHAGPPRALRARHRPLGAPRRSRGGRQLRTRRRKLRSPIQRNTVQNPSSTG